MIELYADGSCRRKYNGCGGWAYLYKLKEVSDFGSAIIVSNSGYEIGTTNNRMELIAIIKGLESLIKRDMENEKVRVISDSQFAIKGAAIWIRDWELNNWKTTSGRDVANKDLWLELQSLSKNFIINWNWVRGHPGHKENELVDRLAKEASYRAITSLQTD